MKISQLKAIIKRGESEVLEFKTSVAGLHPAMQTTCAFLNSEVGGTVLIGVKDNGEIKGLFPSFFPIQYLLKTVHESIGAGETLFFVLYEALEQVRSVQGEIATAAVGKTIF